jgi:hypothetical protein
MPENPYNFMPPGGQFNDLIGDVLASAATIAPTKMVHHVSGVAAIATITPPHEGFTGPLWLVADGAWSWTAGGNIAVASTTVATANKAYPFIYDRKAAKWYPVVVAAAS